MNSLQINTLYHRTYHHIVYRSIIKLTHLWLSFRVDRNSCSRLSSKSLPYISCSVGNTATSSSELVSSLLPLDVSAARESWRTKWMKLHKYVYSFMTRTDFLMKKARVTLQLSWPFVNAHWADDRHVPVILIFYAEDVLCINMFFWHISLPGVRIGQDMPHKKT